MHVLRCRFLLSNLRGSCKKIFAVGIEIDWTFIRNMSAKAENKSGVEKLVHYEDFNFSDCSPH